MQNFLMHRNTGSSQLGLLSQSTATPASLVEVLWRRRWTLVLTVIVCVLGAAIYLTAATRVYSSSATVMIQQNAPKAFSENTGFMAGSETFLQTQADVFRSTSVLTRALETAGYRTMKTFAKAGSDPVAWLRNGHGFKVDVPRKSDTVVVTMESTNAEEAATFVNSVTAAYLIEQAQQKKSTGEEMVRALQTERAGLLSKRDACLASLLKFKLDKGVLSFKDDKNNIAQERVTALANSLNSAEIVTMELRAQEKSTREAISNPASLAAFVAAQQTKGHDSADHEYDELRHQLIQQALAIGQNNTMLGSVHPRMQMLKSIGDELKKRIAEKDLAIAQAQLVLVTSQLQAAEEKER